VHRKKTILFSHIFAFLGAASSAVCVVAGSPELLMLGRIIVGVNSGMTTSCLSISIGHVCLTGACWIYVLRHAAKWI